MITQKSNLGVKKAEMAHLSTSRRAVSKTLGISCKHLARQSKLEAKDKALKVEIMPSINSTRPTATGD